jgi:citrate synthase
MTSAGDRRESGPLDDASWPDKLTARVVRPGPRPAIHGYDVEGDLSQHYSFTETVLLALTGELPTEVQSRAFEIALQFLSPVPINEAPTHATVVARVCNVMTTALIGTAAIGLAEQARVDVAAHAGWLQRLESTEVSAVAEYAPCNDDERQSVQRLREALQASGIALPMLTYEIGRMPALLATLHFAGLTRAEQVEAAFVLARFPCAIAEALATPSHSFREYPVQLPPFSYTESA